MSKKIKRTQVDTSMFTRQQNNITNEFMKHVKSCQETIIQKFRDHNDQE